MRPISNSLAAKGVFTHDTDFLRLASETSEHPGIVYCHKNAHSIGEIIDRLILIYEIISPPEIAGRVEFI